MLISSFLSPVSFEILLVQVSTWHLWSEKLELRGLLGPCGGHTDYIFLKALKTRAGHGGSQCSDKIHTCNNRLHCVLPNNDLTAALTCLPYMTER